MGDNQFTNVTEDGYYVHPFRPIKDPLNNMDYYLEVNKDQINLRDLGLQDRLDGLDIDLRVPFFASFTFGNEVNPMYYFDFDVEIKIVGENIEGPTERLSMEDTLKCYRADDDNGRVPDDPIVLHYNESGSFHQIIEMFNVGDINLEINVYTKGFHKDPEYGTKIVIPINIDGCESLKPTGNLYVNKGTYPPYGEITPVDWGITKGVSNIAVGGNSLSFKKGAFFKNAYAKLFKGNDLTTPIKEFTVDPGTDTTIKSFGELFYTDDMEVGDYTVQTGFSDSRNFSVSENFQFTLFEYNSPIINTIKTRRCDSNGTIDNQGSYLSIDVDYTLDQTQPNNLTFFRLSVYDRNENKEISLDAWSGAPPQMPIISGSGKIKVDNSYDVEIWINDKVNRDSRYFAKKDVVEDTSYSTLDFLAGGKGISFGIDAYKEGFQCAMDAEFNNSVVMEKGLNVTGGNVNFEGPVTMQNTLGVTEQATFAKTIVVGGNTTLNGALNVAQATNLKNGLTVTGTSTFNSQVNFNGIVNYSNSPDIRIGNGRTRTSVNIGATNTNHYYAIADTGTVTNSYSDRTAILLVSTNYVGGKTGILRISQRTNDQTASSTTWSSCEIRWLSNDGWETDAFILRYTSAKSNNRAILYYNSKAAYDSISVTVLHNGPRVGESAAWVLSAPLTYSNAVASMGLSSQLTPTLSGGMGSQYANSYYGLMNPQRDASNWIRTTANGLLPYKSGGGSSSLGTNSWPFNQVVAQHLLLGPAGSVEQVKDVVVNSGSSGAWTWRKWASGVAEVWGWKSVNVNSSTAWGNIYYGGPFSCGNWPFTFYQSGPITLIRTEDNNGRFWLVAAADNTTQSPGFYTLSAGPYGTQAIGICIYAKGWWRAANYNRI